MAEKTAAQFFNGWLAIFGAPASIISDWDKCWMSGFWKALMEKLQIKFHMTSAFHPQADGRRKKSNKTIGQILRKFTAKRQSHWVKSLPAVKFAINSAINISTGYSTFEIVFGSRPRLFPSSSNYKKTSIPPWGKNGVFLFFFF
jgi:hypothetical protein